MNLKSFYKTVNGEYADVMDRFLKEATVIRFLKKFAETNDYQLLNDAIDGKNWTDAFRFSHNIKGISLNLSITPLAKKVSQLCEAVRGGECQEDLSELRLLVDEEYTLVMQAIKKLD